MGESGMLVKLRSTSSQWVAHLGNFGLVLDHFCAIWPILTIFNDLRPLGFGQKWVKSTFKPGLKVHFLVLLKIMCYVKDISI